MFICTVFKKKSILNIIRIKENEISKNIFKSPFSILWWSGTLSSFGDWATLFASVALASYLGATDGNSELTAVVPVVARIIPAFMSSFAGLLADRFNKKNVMIISDLVRMVVVLGLFFTTTLFNYFNKLYC